MSAPTRLRRSITTPFLILYGVGTMVGGGFYALLGKVAGEAGMYAPVALALTGLLALLIAASFAELSSRFPVSAGESRYVAEGFNSRLLSTVVGWMVVLTGIVSAAALSVASIGFLKVFVEVPMTLGIAGLILGMAVVSVSGIGQSVGVVALITVIELGALIYAMFVADADLKGVVENWRTFVPPMDLNVWGGIFSAAFLALYAFIGFEDMVNIAEEVQDVRRTLPVAIGVSVSLTILLYVSVSTIAVSSIPPAQLAQSPTPIAALASGGGQFAIVGLGIVSILTGLNGALVQIIMASRVAYGLAREGQAPAWFHHLHPTRQTPVRATILITVIILLLALFFPLITLARVASTIILLIFTIVNLSLWRVIRRDPDLEGEGPRFPGWLPMLGAIACASVLLFQGWIFVSAWGSA